MQDSLIGYLLGALDESEMARFEERLKRDPALQAQLLHAARSLQVLRQDPDDDIEPPSNLAAATCAFVRQASRAALSRSGYEHSADSSGWTIIDVSVACGVLLCACLLLFPAVNNSRYHAQIAGCQNNLRSIGRALIEYSGTNAQGLFPQVPETGNMAVAGMYAPTLISQNLVTEDHNFFCPASSDIDAELVRRIPTVDEVQRATGQTLPVVQRRMGGDYGYMLGVLKNGHLRGIRNRSRTHFAIMSDTPRIFDVGCSGAPQRLHRNVLFESGGVRVVRVDIVAWHGDQLYKNDHGEVSAGVHESDTVIGASDTAPMYFD